LARFEAEGESFLCRIVTANGSIILNRLQKGSPWNNTVFNLLGKKRSLSAGKVMITLFRDCEEMILMDAMPKGKTVNY
jgi:hypothetical protein